MKVEALPIVGEFGKFDPMTGKPEKQHGGKKTAKAQVKRPGRPKMTEPRITIHAKIGEKLGERLKAWAGRKKWLLWIAIEEVISRGLDVVEGEE